MIDGFSNLDADGIESILIPDGSSSVSIEITVTQNGSDFFGIDNFKVIGISASAQSVGFDSQLSQVNETDANVNALIPVTLSNYAGSQVDLSVSVSGGSAEQSDYTLNTTSLSFTSSSTQNVSIDINDDSDIDNETIEITLVETTSTGIILSNATHVIEVTDDDTPNIIITEIMYNTPSTDDEWIEIYNSESQTVDLSDWTIEINGSTEFTFESSSSIGSGEYVTIALGSNGDGSFNNDNPFTPDFNSLGVLNSEVASTNNTNNINNSGALISIKTPGGSIADETNYDDDAIPSSDGDGPTLSLSDLSFDNSDMTNWAASATLGGTPGMENDVTVWTGAVGSEVITSGNWTNGSPNSTLSVFIPSDASVIPLINDNIEVAALRLGDGKSLIIQSGALTVNNELIYDGFIEVFSEASLLPMGSLEGTGTVTIMKNTPFTTQEGKYSVIGSPVSDGMTDALGSIVYAYDETVAYGANGNDRFVAVTTAESMEAGDAYFSANTGSISFTGTPNSGTITQSLVYDETADGGASNAGFNLVSNPYTASIDVAALVSAHSDISASFYLWQDENSAVEQGSNDDYVVYNSTTGMSTRTTPEEKILMVLQDLLKDSSSKRPQLLR